MAAPAANASSTAFLMATGRFSRAGTFGEWPLHKAGVSYTQGQTLTKTERIYGPALTKHEHMVDYV